MWFKVLCSFKRLHIELNYGMHIIKITPLFLAVYEDTERCNAFIIEIKWCEMVCGWCFDDESRAC